MIEFSGEIEIPATRRRVWEVLTDFETYPDWNPYIAIRGGAALGSEIRWAYSSQVVKRVWTRAIITEFDAPNAITWTFRIGWLFSFEESLRLHQIREGTELTHLVQCRGFVARLGKHSLRKTIAAVVSAANEGLRRHVCAGVVSLRSPAARANRRSKAKKKGSRARSDRR